MNEVFVKQKRLQVHFAAILQNFYWGIVEKSSGIFYTERKLQYREREWLTVFLAGMEAQGRIGQPVAPLLIA